MTRSPTPAPVTKLVMPVTKVRTGRPLLGQVAMTAAERQRRRRAALKDVPNDTPETWARATVLKATPVSAAIARLDFWGWAATGSFWRAAASPDFVDARARAAAIHARR